jgi:hypothetical protein
MKKKLIRCIAVTLITSVLSLTSSGQEMTSRASTGQMELTETPALNFSKPVAEPLKLNEIAMKAIRNFAQEFSNVQDAKWYRTKEGFVAYGREGNGKVRVYYDCRGKHICTFRTYDETALSKAVRHLVKRNYYDYDIFCVTEISAGAHVAYYVKLESKTSWMDVKVANDEIERLKEYWKR